MTVYSDGEPEDGYYEVTLGFFWKDDRDEDPQYVTVDFQVTSEMEEDYPGREEEDEYGLEEAERMREDWVRHHLGTLLDRGFVTEAYGHDEISSVSDLEELRSDMDFNAYYA